MRQSFEFALIISGDEKGGVRAIDVTERRLGKLDRTQQRTIATNRRMKKSFVETGNSMRQMQRYVSGALFVSFGASALRAADDMTRLDARLKIVSDSNAEFAQTQSDIVEVSNETRTSLKSTTDFYVRLQQRLKNMNVEQGTALELTELTAKALKVQGASTLEASAAMTQFSQALAANRLGGDEFRSLSENAPRLMQAIADGIGVPIGALKELSKQGQLTTEVIVAALKTQSATIDAEFSQMPITIRDAFQLASNEALAEIRRLNTEFDFSGQAAQGILKFVDVAKVGIKYSKELLTAIIGLYAAQRLGPMFAALGAGIAATTASVQRFGVGLVALNARAAATTAVLTGLRKGVALLGGPAGIAILAATALLTMGSGAKSAEQDVSDLRREVDLLTKSSIELSLQEASQGLSKTRIEIQEAQTRLRELNAEIVTNTSIGEEYASSNEHLAEQVSKVTERLSLLQKKEAALSEDTAILNGKVLGLSGGFESFGESADKSANKLANLAGGIVDYGSKIEGILKAEKERREEIQALNQYIRAHGDATGALTKRLQSLTGATKANKTEFEQFTARLDGLSKESELADKKLAELERRYKSGAISARSFEKELKRIDLTAKQVNRVLQSHGLEVSDVDKAYKEINKTLKENQARQKVLIQGGEAAAKVYDQLKAAADQYDISVEELIQKYPQLSEEIRRANEAVANNQAAVGAIRSIRDELVQVAIYGRDFGDFIKNLMKKIAADILAAGIDKAIAKVFGFSLGGGGGIDYSQIIGSIFGGGGSSSSGGGGLNLVSIGRGIYSYLGGGSAGATAGTSGAAIASEAAAAAAAQTASEIAAANAYTQGNFIGAANYGGTGSGATANLGAYATYAAAAAIYYDAITDLTGARSPQQIAAAQAARLSGYRQEVDSEDGSTDFVSVAGNGQGLREIGNTMAILQGFQDRAGGGREAFVTGQTSQQFGDFAQSRGLDVINYGAGVKVIAQDQEQLNQLINDFNVALGEVGVTSESLKASIDAGMISPAKTFEQNWLSAFGGTRETARKDLAAIDKLFDKFAANGIADSEAVYKAISEHFSISTEAARSFVSASGLSADQFAAKFRSASGSAIKSIRDFASSTRSSFSNIEGDASIAAGAIASDFQNAANSISRSFNGVRINGGISATRGPSEPLDLGGAADALVSSKSFDVPDYSAPYQSNGIDKRYQIALAPKRESVTVSRKGLLEEIKADVAKLSESRGGSRSDQGLVDAVRSLVDVLTEALESRPLDLARELV